MKLVRYIDPEQGSDLQLHPQVNVVRGLSPDARGRFLADLAAVPRGGPLCGHGTISVHGVTLDLNAETLELLELDEDLDVVLRRWDIPGNEDERPDQLDPERDAELASLGRAVDDARIANDAAVTHLHELNERLAERQAARSDLDAQVEAERAGLDEGAPTDLSAANDALERLRSARAAEAESRRAALRLEVSTRLDELAAQAEELRRRLRRPTSDPSEPVRAAIEHLDAVSDPTPVPVPEARSLAAMLASATEDLASIQDKLVGGRSQLMELTARRDAAYDAFVTAELNLRTPDLDPAVLAELERVHDEIFEMDARVSRLSAARLRRRASTLRLRETTLLKQLGFETWSEYVMGVASPEAEAERQRRYEVAKATYEFAEDELARAAAQPAHDSPDLRAAERRVSELREQAARLLGRSPGPDPVAELREHTVPAGSLRGSLTSAGSALRVALAEAGEHVPADESATALRDRAQAWLDGLGDRERELTELQTRYDQVEATIAATSRELELLSVEHPAADVADDDPELLELRARLDAATVRVDAHRVALDRVGRLRARLAELVAEIGRLTDEVAAAERDVSLTVARLDAAVEELTEAEQRWRLVEAERIATRRAAREARGADLDVDAIEWYLLARLAAQRSVSYVGSMPIAIDDAFGGWSTERLASVYHRLARMSDVVQVIMVSDDEDVARWALGLGASAAVIDAG